MRSKWNNGKGFTLIELIAVIAILLILILLITPRFMGHLEKARLAHIQNDIKIAEEIISEHLIEHNNLPKEWTNTSTNKLQRLANLRRLYNVEGLENSVPEGEYKEINKQYLKDKISTKLDGTFYTDNIGKVYYESNKSAGGSQEDDLFDREIEEEEINQDKIKILKHNFPNGIYVSGDTIKGDVKVEGIQAGTYTLNADIIHSKDSKTIINDLVSFNLDVGEIKVIDFQYKVTSTDRVGFYDLNVKINEDSEELAKYKVLQSIYIAQPEWEYFYEDDLYGVDFPSFAGIGSLDPSKVSYEYVLENPSVEAPSGRDYSSIKINIDANDNKTGQAATILPITYGTYEALMKVPNSDALLNGFFLYGTDKYDIDITYEIDMEVLFYEGQWELWATVYNETHKDYNKGEEDPGIIFQKRIKLDFDPSEDFHSYRIDFYEKYVSFALDGVEIARWNNSFNYGDMHMYTGTFYTHWLTGELSTIPLQMDVQWMRRGYLSK